MPKLTSGIYFEVTEIDWEDPRQVEGAKRVMAEMRHFIRNLKGTKYPFQGTSLPSKVRHRHKVSPARFAELAEAIEQAKGDLKLAAVVLRQHYSSVYNRILIYKKKGYFRQLPDKTWRVVEDNEVVRDLRALTA